MSDKKENPTPSVESTSYYIWITALTDVYESSIISALIKKGYTISAATGDSSTVTKTGNSTSAIITLRVDIFDKKSALDINNDVIDIMNKANMLYHSIVVASASGTVSWVSSNIRLPSEKNAPATPAPSRSDLN